VVVQQRIVPGWAGAVVAQVFAGHVGIGREPFTVAVASLPRTRGAIGTSLAVRRDAVAARAGRDRVARGGYIDHQPVREIHARQIGRNVAALLVDIVALAGHVDIDASEREGFRPLRRTAPG